MVEAFSFAANTIGITLIAADISAVDYLGEPSEINKMYGSKDTILCELSYDEPWYKEVISLQREMRKAERTNNISALAEMEQKASRTPFTSWSPFASSDTSTSLKLGSFWRQHGLIGFPFHGTDE